MRVETPFLDTSEAAQFLRIKRATLYSWIQAPECTLPIRKHGRKIVFHRDELKEWSDVHCKS